MNGASMDDISVFPWPGVSPTPAWSKPGDIVNRTDAAARKATTANVAAVALFAAGDSYTHIYDLARQDGEGMVSAALLPSRVTG